MCITQLFSSTDKSLKDKTRLLLLWVGSLVAMHTLILTHTTSAAKPVHIPMARRHIPMTTSRISKSRLKAELCFHCYVHLSCAPIYIYIYIYIYRIPCNFFKKVGTLALNEIIPAFVVTEDDTVSNILAWFSVFCKILKFFLWIPHRCRSGVLLAVHGLHKLIGNCLRWFIL